MRNIAIVLLVLAVAFVGFAFVSSQSGGMTTQTNPPAGNTSQTASASVSSSSTSMDEEVKIVDVEAGSFYFKPNEIRVKKGEKVRIVMTAVSMMHDFVIDELDVKMPVVQNGSTGTVEFTPQEAGEFEYYCSVGQHRANGQFGKLIVEE